MATVVNSGTSTFGKGGSSSVVLGAAPTSGNLLVAGMVAEAEDVSTINNNLIDSGLGQVTNTSWVRLYYRICDGTESDTTTVALTGTASGQLWVCEYNGVGVFEAADQNTGSDDTPTGANPGGSADLTILLSGMDGAVLTFSTPTSGWAIESQTSDGVNGICASHHLSGDGSENGDVLADASGDWETIHAAFTAAATGIEILRLRSGGY